MFTPEKLKKITNLFTDEIGLIPLLAAEIEFYLKNGTQDKYDLFKNSILTKSKSENIALHKFETERGHGQFEMVISFFPNPEHIANQIIKLKSLANDLAAKSGMIADFSAKPFDNMPGSGMHIHLSLHDKKMKNLFAKSGEDNETETMLYSIGGLLEIMEESMIFFAPNEDSYKRFTPIYNRESETHNNAPTNISWGGNNRTTALRIPSSTHASETRHIEHRVAGADADPHQVLSAILAGVYHGIKNKIKPNERIYGNAYDKAYGSVPYSLKPLPKDLATARKLFEEGGIVKDYCCF